MAFRTASPSAIRVWTIQRADCWKQVRRDGVLRADGRRIWRHFRPAYRWLMEQMARRLPDYVGGFPVWFWHSPKPDLRNSAHLETGTRGVRLEAGVPADRVLLLDFDAWHCVLNHWRLSMTEREDDAWDKRVKLKGPLTAALEEELQVTWERVFDLATLKRSPLWKPVRHIQGVTEYIRLDEIVRADRFIAR